MTCPEPAQFARLARPYQDLEAVARLRRLTALLHPQTSSPLAGELAAMLAGETLRLDTIGIRRIVTERCDFTSFSRNHPYLDEVMQDENESRREWEKSFLRSSGCYRNQSGDYGKVVMVPSLYLWIALALHQAAIAPAPEGL